MDKIKLTYKRKCLKCLYFDNSSHELIWEKNYLPYDSKYPRDTLGHQFILSLRGELNRSNIKCSKCEAIGSFDVFDIASNGKPTYSRPLDSIGLIDLTIEKVNGIANPKINA